MSRLQPEFRLQVLIADLLRLRARPGLYWTALPLGEARPRKKDKHGNWRSPAGERLKRMGVRDGAPDILLIWEGGAIGLELKPAPKPGKRVAFLKGEPQSDAQKLTEEDWTAAGGLYFLARGYEAAVGLLEMLGCIYPVQGDQRFAPRQTEPQTMGVA